MASSNDELSQLLRNLASKKGLNTQAPASTASATLQTAQNKFRDYAVNSIAAAPNLQERIQQIASGKPAPPSGLSNLLLNNPVSKTALGALYAWDTPRRAVISGVREIVDILDSDPNTKASFGDFYNQAKQADYGFGTAFPMEGWTGRIVGAFGDILLDPMLTSGLGNRIAKKAVAEGAEVFAKQAGEVVARDVFGKNIVGAEARSKLAEWTAREMRAQNAVKRAAGMAEDYTEDRIAKISSDIAAKGKRYVPTEIAERFGIPKAGVYFFGGRVRVKGSGLIGDMVESGITKMRLGIANSRPGEAVLQKITRTGVGGALAPLSAEYVRSARMGLARGNLTGSQVTTALRLLNIDESRRVATTFAAREAEKMLAPIVERLGKSEFRMTVSRLLDNATDETLRTASAEERAIAEAISPLLAKMYGDVNAAMKAVDPGFRMGEVKKYFPWVLSDDARKIAASERSARAEYILKYSKIDVNDMASSFNQRGIHEGMEFFGVRLTKEDLNARRLNDIARKELGVDLFETDAVKALANYANNYAEQMGNAAFFAQLAQEPDMMKFIKQNFEVPESYLASLEENAANSVAAVGDSMKQLGSTLNKAASALDAELKRAAGIAQKDIERAGGFVVTDEAAQASNKAVVDALAELNASKDALTAARTQLSNFIEGEGGVVGELQLQLQDLEAQIAKLNDEAGRDLVEAATPRDIPTQVKLQEPQQFVDAETGKVRTVGTAFDPAAIEKGTFAETSPVESLTRDDILKGVQQKVEELNRKLVRTYQSYNGLKEFHNELANMAMHIDEARVGDITTPFVDRLLDTQGWKYTEAVYGDKKPVEIISTKGKIWQDVIVKYFKAENQSDPLVRLVRNAIDPTGKMSQNALKRLTQSEVRARLIASTTTSMNLGELQEAVAWMMLRELRLNPEIERLVGGLATEADERTMQIFSRFKKLQELNKQASEMNDVMLQVNKAVEEGESGLTRVGATTQKVTGSRAYAEAESYYDVTNELTQVQNEIRNGEIAAARVDADAPIVRIATDFQNFVGTRTGRVPAEELDTLVLALANEGYDDVVRIVDERADVITYEQLNSVLDFFKESELRTIARNSPALMNDATMKALRSRETALLRRKDYYWKKLSSGQKLTHATLQSAGGFQDFVRNYSDTALEMYMMSETTLQFRRLSEVYAPYGIVPSFDMWAEIRADVAKNLYKGAEEFGTSFNQAVSVLEGIQSRVQSLKAGDQYAALRDEMTKLLSSKDGANVRRFFPEFQAMLNRGGLSEYGRLLISDPENQQLRNQLQDMYAQLRAQKQGGRRVGQAGQVTGAKEIRSEADVAILEKNAAKLRSNRANATGSIEAQIARIQSGKASSEELISEIENLLEEGVTPFSAESMKGARDTAKVGWVDPEQFQAKLDELKTQSEKVKTRIKADQKLARGQAKAAGISGRAGLAETVGKFKRTRAGNYQYGFAGLFYNAISPSESATAVRSFFGELLGGTYKYVDNKVVAVERSSSYAARTMDFINRRRSALANMMDTSVPVTEQQLASNVLPGLSGFKGKDSTLLGIRYYADELNELGKLLRMQLANDADFEKLLTQAGVSLADAKKGLPFTPEQIDNMRVLIEQMPERHGPNMWRYIDSSDSVIKTLPKEMQDAIYEFRALKLREQRLLFDDYFPVAQKEKTLHDVIGALSRLELDKLYDATGAASFDPFSQYGRQVWNAPRPDVFDGLGNPVFSNADSVALENFLASLPERRGVFETPLGKGGRQTRYLDHFVIQANQVPFDPRAMSVDKSTGRQISNRIFLDKDGLMLKTAENGETPFEQARRLYNQGEPLTVLEPKPIRAVEVMDGITEEQALRNAARIHSGDVYDPATTWVLLPDELGKDFETYKVFDEVTGQQVDRVRAPITKKAMALKLPINQNSASRFAFKYEGKPLVFTTEEARALFNPPIIEDDEPLTVLRAKIDDLMKDRPTITRKSTAKDKKLAKSIDAQVDALNARIKEIFDRPLDVKQVGQLRAEIRKFEGMIPARRTKIMTKEARAELIYIDEQIRLRQEQIRVISSFYSARTKVQSMIDQAMKDKDLAYFVGAVKKYGDLPTDERKLFNKIVDRMMNGFTPDGASVAAIGDVADVRKGFVSARFNASDAGRRWADIGEVRASMNASQARVFDKDFKTKINLVEEYQSKVAEISKEYDLAYTTAETVDRIQGTLDRIKGAGFIVEKDGKSFIKTAEGLVETTVPRLRPEGARAVSLLKSDVKTAQSTIKTLKGQRNAFVREVNELESIANPLEGELARIDEIRMRILPDFDRQIAEQAQQVNALNDSIRAVSAGFSGKTADEIMAISDQLFNVKVNRATKFVQGSKEGLAELRRQFGETSQQYRDYKRLLVILAGDKVSGAKGLNATFAQLEAASKEVAERTANLRSVVDVAQKKNMLAQEVYQTAKANYDAITYHSEWADVNLSGAQRRLESINVFRDSLAKVREKAKQDLPMAVQDFDVFRDEALSMIELMKRGAVPKNLKSVMTEYIEKMNTYHATVLGMREGQAELAVAKGVADIYKNLANQGAEVQEWATALAMSKIDAVTIVEEFDKGWVAMGQKFPGMQISPELAEIFNNGHKLRDPEVARQFSQFLGAYTKFFKTYATLSPGFHVRNSLANGMALLFGGGNPLNLSEGLKVSIAWQKAEAMGDTWQQFLAKLPAEQAQAAEVARMSVAASGGGMYSDIAKELATGGKLVNNKVTQTSRKFGELADNHARFMFGYDAGKSGMDWRMASARTKRFFVDYMDMSDLDKTMSTIVPFWMWTSRNLPTQVVNMWLNPKPYLIYNNIKRNISDDTDASLVPQYLKEMGAIKLPFGDNIFMTLDTGYTQVGPQIEMLKDPQRMLSNLNPLLRLPIELAGNRQLYSNRTFSETPIKVEGAVADTLQPFLQSIGWGATNSKGERFVSDKAYYALRNLLPMLGTFERLNPSIQSYRERGTGNQLLGFLGAPVRKVTPEMQAAALNALRREIQGQVAKNKALEGEEE